MHKRLKFHMNKRLAAFQLIMVAETQTIAIQSRNKKTESFSLSTMDKQDNCDDFDSVELRNPRQTRRTYLVTYSRADLIKFPTCESFGKCIKDHFNAGIGKVKVEHWACCREDHEESGQHYHAALKLSGPKRWKTVKKTLLYRMELL